MANDEIVEFIAIMQRLIDKFIIFLYVCTELQIYKNIRVIFLFLNSKTLIVFLCQKPAGEEISWRCLQMGYTTKCIFIPKNIFDM